VYPRHAIIADQYAAAVATEKASALSRGCSSIDAAGVAKDDQIDAMHIVWVIGDWFVESNGQRPADSNGYHFSWHPCWGEGRDHRGPL
jgi:hypothetical protein